MKTSQKGLTRRNFFKWISATGIGGAMFGWRTNDAHSQVKAKNDNTESMQVPTRKFGDTGIRLPILSLGGIFTTGQNHVMMHQAVKWGVTYWDTATRYNYWGSEDGMGKYFLRFPDHRKKIFLVTKSSTINADYLDKELEASLKNLQTDYVDLYFIHKVDEVADELTEEIRRWVEKKKKSGKIKLFGFSTHANMAANLAAAAKLGWIDGIMTTYNYRLMVDGAMNRALDACHKAGIGLTAMKTQAVSTRGHRDMGTETDAALKLTQRFLNDGFTIHQARLMAVWSDPRITSICSQMENMSILKENVSAAVSHRKFTRSDLNRFSDYDRVTASAYCAGCAHICESRLSQAVPVCKVMRYLMYARSYGNAARARRKFRRIPEDIRNIMATLDYSEGEAQCPRNMPIGKLMREAVNELS